ncbi:hypothetical protein Pcinc_006642 [Petrolisthes cinctipes]|uniref:Uncharacterized protein n=1 Tax=Petrolisthes cinctipes TaxID=88211 RepID=A0AAE1GCJ5_PETCI|nr:hypothetical protein Pcinc_006642 [Petrolisthes cinctipes]
MVFCRSVLVLLTTGAAVTTGYLCDSIEKSVQNNTNVTFWVPDTGNLILGYKSRTSHNTATIFFKQQTDGSLKQSQIQDQQNVPFTIYNNDYKNITISYYEVNTKTLVRFVDPRRSNYSTDIPYRVTSVQVRSTDLSWWICTTSLNLQPTRPTTSTTTTTTAATTPTATTTTTVVETNQYFPSASPTQMTTPTTHSSTNQSKGLIIALGVVSVMAVVFFLGLAYYCKKSGHPLVAMNDTSRIKPDVELEAQEGADKHIYEEWDESYRYLIKETEESKSEDQFERNSINSIYQPFDDNI